MGANNQGIVHLRLGGPSGRSVACKRTNTHMATTADKFEAEPRKCVRCAAKWTKMKEIEARRAAREGGR